MHRVGDIQKDPVAGAGSRRQADFRKDGDVVALIRLRRLLRPRPVIAALPQPGDGAGRLVREDPRPVDDARLLRRLDRHLDDVDAEESGFRIFVRLQSRTSGKLLRRAHRARAGAVEIDVALIVGVGDEGVGVRSPAGLYRGDLLRHAHVGDVEDADAAETLGAHRLVDALDSAVEAAPGLFHRHEQQVPEDGHVALAAGADHGDQVLRRRRVLDVVGIEPVEIADEEPVPAEREVRVREVQEARPPGVFGRILLLRLFLLLLLFLLGLPLRRHGLTAGCFGIEEACRFGNGHDQLQVARRHSGVLEAGLESDAGIGRGRGRPTRALLLAARHRDGGEHHGGGETQNASDDGSHCGSSLSVPSMAPMRAISML